MYTYMPQYMPHVHVRLCTNFAGVADDISDEIPGGIASELARNPVIPSPRPSGASSPIGSQKGAVAGNEEPHDEVDERDEEEPNVLSSRDIPLQMELT